MMDKQINLTNSEDDDNHQLSKHLQYDYTTQVRDKSAEQLQRQCRFDIIGKLPYDIVIKYSRVRRELRTITASQYIRSMA